MTPSDSATSTPADFMITQVLDAPRDRVFGAWTQGDELAKWFGPPGCTLHVQTLDLRPGGVFHYAMDAPDGNRMWGKWTFREIVEPERLVVVVSFCDEHGSVVRHPFAPEWPLETLSTTTFAHVDGTTTLTIRWRPFDATQAEIAAFGAGHATMTQGWNGTFEQLRAYLAPVAP